MKSLILRFALVFLSFSSFGQTINEMEYFFDIDPGYGMATSVTIASGNTINENFNVPTALPLTTGFHDLFVRVKETGGVMFITLNGPTPPPALTRFEVGEVVTGATSGATGVVLAAFDSLSNQRLVISTTGTFTPVENLTGGTSGATATLNAFTANWSIPESRLVYVDPTGAGTVLVEELEYFFDMDPGYDMGTKFTAFTATAVANEMENISTSGLIVGFHTLYVRAKAVGGVWGIPESRLVFVDETGSGVILVEEVEYFFDTDPGYDMGTKFTAFTAANTVNQVENFSTASLSTGFHTLFIRAKSVGNTWGVPESRLVYVDPTGAGLVLVEEVEYFFDSDPGYDMGTKFTAFTAGNAINQVENVSTSSLSTGFHTLFIRAKSVGNTWSIPESRLVYVDPTGAGLVLVEEVEYFFDTDPGYDMGTKFTAFTAANVVNQMENLSTGGLSTGFHTLFLRAKSVGNTWGIPESRLVYVDPSGGVSVNITAIEYFFDVDPGAGMATAVTITTPGFNITEMFDIPEANIPLGTHTLGIRAQNEDGVWGMLETKSITSEKDNALNFDGVDDFIAIPDVAGLDLTSSGTLTAWINPTTFPSNGECMRILSKSWGAGGQVQNSPYQLMICGTEEIRITIGDNTNSQVLSSSSRILLNEWTHVAASWDGSNLSLFINGILVRTNAQTVVPFANAEDLYVGSMDGISFPLQGDLDDVSIWNVAKTETEIQDILTDGLAGSESNLIAYYTFDEGIAGADNTGISSLPDQTSNANDGTLNNFALNGTLSNWVDKGLGAMENVPGEPVNLFITEVSTSQIDLSWTDRSFNETDFAIERSDGNNASFSPIATVGSDVITFSDNTVTADNGYYYRVKATNANGDSPFTDEKFGSTITQPGNALQFDGVDDYVDVGDIGLDFTTSPFTIEFWAKRDAIGTTGDWIINIGEEPSVNNESIHAGFVSGNQFSFDFKGDALTTDESFTDTDWHHWVVIYDPDLTADDDDRKIYLDGVLLKTDDPTGGFTGSNYFKIGQAFDSEFFGGVVDEVRVWDDVRTDIEITSFINSTLVGNEANLVAYYRLDQDEITDLIVPDRSANDNPGTWMDGGGGTTTPQWVTSEGLDADLTPPVPVTQDITVSLDATGNVTITPTQVDNGSSDDKTIAGNLLLSLDLTSFDCTNVGDNMVMLTVTDESGKSASSTAIVTVLDDILPIVVTQAFTITLDASDQAIIQTSDVDNGTSDNCTFTLSLDITTFTKAELGDNTVSLTAIDAGGNSVSAIATVTVLDNNNPPTVITQDITVSLNASGTITITPDQIDNGSSDDITTANDLLFALDIISFDCSNVGDNTVILTVTDESAESASATAIVTVVDDILPTVITQDFVITLDASDLATIQVSDIDNGTSDNCTFTSSLDITTFTKAELGDNTVTLTAVDGVGNSASTTAIVTVLDNNQAPDFFYTFYLDENTTSGKLIGTIVATDPEGDPLVYSILSGNTNDAFAVDNEGNLSVNSQSALDFEVTPSFMLIVQADDGLGGVAMVSITINLNDIDEDVLGIGDSNELISVYPNPVQETLFIKLEEGSLQGIEVKMFTVSGRQVLTSARIKHEGNKLISLDLGNLKPGIYLLKIQNDEEIVTRNILLR